MVNSYNMRSKIYIKPTRGAYIFKLSLNICLIVVIATSVFKMIMDGPSLQLIGWIAIAIIIVSGVKNRPQMKPHYESSFVDISLDEKRILLKYPQLDGIYKDISWNIDFEKVNAFEYSSKLNCLHIVGDIKLINIKSEKVINLLHDHYLYFEAGFEKDVLGDIADRSNIHIKNMDAIA